MPENEPVVLPDDQPKDEPTPPDEDLKLPPEPKDPNEA